MRKIQVSFLILGMLISVGANGNGKCSSVQRNQITNQKQLQKVLDIIKKHESMKKKPMPEKQQKEKAIIIYQAAVAVGVRPELLAAIVAVESGFRQAARSHTGDIGIAQINPVNIPQQKLLQVSKCETDNLSLGAQILAAKKRRFGHEPQWYCRYNVGTARKLTGQRLKNCLKYAKKVEKYL